jgi:16S rRNA (guanine527-N7)-methyltransferase
MAHKNETNWSPNQGKQKRPQPPRSGRHRKPVENYSFDEADDRIYDVFNNHGFGDYPHAKRRQLTRFYQLLMENQTKQNFTRILDLRDVAIKHFIDCLMVSRQAKLKFPLLDLGSGPGFPGIPLKIDLPDETIILAEGVQRRVEFLKMVRSEMNLQKLPIIGRNVDIEFFYPVQGVITRAVEDARNTLGKVVNSLQTNGRVYLMKGPGCQPEIQPALDAWGEYFELDQDVGYQLPNSPHERRLLVFRKIKPHPLPDFVELDLAWERELGLGAT